MGVVITKKPQNFQYIAEDTTAGTLVFTPPARFSVVSAEFKLDTDAAIILNNDLALLGFYGGGNTPQQATPVTLADVIVILQNVGLCI